MFRVVIVSESLGNLGEKSDINIYISIVFCKKVTIFKIMQKQMSSFIAIRESFIVKVYSKIEICNFFNLRETFYSYN